MEVEATPGKQTSCDNTSETWRKINNDQGQIKVTNKQIYKFFLVIADEFDLQN